MSDVLPQDFCPYKGLQPYTEADRAFFFGRERDSEIIASNLYAAPLTVLYGESGVGKSSVLLAGVVPLLRQTPNVAVVIFRQWQDAQFATILRTEILKAVKETSGKEANVDLSLPLDEFLVACNRILRGPVFFIFDQFEEFFLYHAVSESAEGFDAEWARSVNRQDVDANFLISLREDSLSRLDRFRGRIPKLLGNMLRLKHLNGEAGRDAIRKPLEKYNQRRSGTQPGIAVEDALVETLLEEIQTGRVTLTAGRGQVNAQGAEKEAQTERIETPFLQMVLTRLWNEESAEGSRILRLSTLEKLGGAERIIRTHLDKVMEKLSGSERDVAAQLFRFLVTPSGSKIAHTTSDLISYAEMPGERVEPVLELLSSPDVRILRPIAPPLGQENGFRYEIFHDVLAQAVLDWRGRYSQEQKRLAAERELGIERARAAEKLHDAQRRTRRLRWGATGLMVIVFITMGLLGLALKQRNEIKQTRIDGYSRELAAYSIANTEIDPYLSLLLAIKSASTSMTEDSIIALRKSLEAQRTQFVLHGHTGAVRGVAFSPDNKYLATASWDKTARIWDVATGKEVSLLQHDGEVTSVAFSPDGKYLATSSFDMKVRVWENWQTNAPRVAALIEEGREMWSVMFSPYPEGRYLATSGTGMIRVWDWKTEAGPQMLSEMPHPKNVYAIAFSPDGKFVAAGSESPILLVWEWEKDESELVGSQNPISLAAKGAVYYVAFSRDGRYLGAVCGDRAARIWDWKDVDKLSTPVKLSKSVRAIRGLAFSPDGQLVATANEDDKVRLWAWLTEEGRVNPQELKGHQDIVFAVAFSPDGKYFATGSEDQTARIWRTQDIDPVKLNQMSGEELLRVANSRVTRPFTPEERRKYIDDSHDH